MEVRVPENVIVDVQIRLGHHVSDAEWIRLVPARAFPGGDRLVPYFVITKDVDHHVVVRGAIDCGDRDGYALNGISRQITHLGCQTLAGNLERAGDGRPGT